MSKSMVRVASILSAILLIAAGFWGWVSYSNSREVEEVTVKRVTSTVAARPSVRLGAERDAGDSQTIARLGGNASDDRRGLTAGISVFDPDAEYEDGELVVVNPPANFETNAAELGFTVIETISLRTLALTIFRVRIPRDMDVPDARRTLTARFPGTLIDANHRYDPSEVRRPRVSASKRSDRGTTRAAVMSRARAAIGWTSVPMTCGKGVRLGMIDSGVDLDHPALTGQKIEFRSFHNPKRKQGPSVHGTSVAALLIGKPSAKGWGGLLPGAELVAANMFEINDTGKKVGNVVSLLKSLDWLASKEVHAINLSIAGSDNSVVRKTIDKARKRGLVLIAAAGNWGRADRPAYPAAYQDVVAVTAVGAYRGVYKYANQGEYIDFAAPGVRLWTAVPGGGRYQSGTSFAAPYLTALIALEIAHGGSKDPKRLRTVISKATADLGAPGKDAVYGWGFVEKQPDCRS